MPLSQGFNVDGNGNIGVAGLATTTAPTYTTGTEQSLSLTLAGGLRVDGTGVTQPVSASSLPLPAGAATSALQTSGNASLTSIDAGIPAALGAATIANSMPVTIASDQIVPISAPSSNTGVLTSVTSSASSVVLLAASGTTKSWVIVNDSTSILYVACAATATATTYTFKLFPNQTVSPDFLYNGVLSGIWASANGAAKITQFT